MSNHEQTAENTESQQREDEVLRHSAGEARKVILPRTEAAQPIVGGEPTRDFPDCCAVGSAAGYFCSGTLIAPTLVVTARHCTNVSRVFLKGWDVQHPEDGETIAVSKQFAHPSYDLRVLVLAEASTVRPRHVARGAEVGTPAKVLLVGFGTIDTEGRVGYGLKRMVTVPLVSLGCATEADLAKYGCRKGKEVVAGHRGLLKDSCHGDSGGPLYIKNSQGGYDLLGATSRGIGGTENECGDGGIYVRVDQFLGWITETTHVTV